MQRFKEFLKDYKEKEENKLICGLKDMERMLEEMKPVVDEYYALQRKYHKKKKIFEEMKKQENLSTLIKECKYRECEYPDMGYSAEDGEATFESKNQGESLIRALRAKASYYYAYVLEWNGVGKYKVVPSWKYDHDSEVVYTATFVKDDSNEVE